MENVFGPLKFYDELIAADVPDRQARAQAEALRSAFATYDASRMKDLATKGDLAIVQNDLREVELRLENRIENSKQEILKCVIGAIITQTALIVAVIGIAVAILLK